MHKKKKKPLIILFCLLFLITFIFFVYKTLNIYSFAFHLFFDKEVVLKQTNNNINILLLGIGGGSHDGPNLTDTIILATINQKDNKVVLTSIPRDLWVPSLTTPIKKINEAYNDGETKREGGGLVEAKAVVKKVTGQEVDYAVRIDFSGFVKAVDVIGGIDVNVENTFDDYVYPISGKEDDSCGFSEEDIQQFVATTSAEEDIQQKFECRYKHIHFDKGIQHMDGETALEFVRSRHATGKEGTDFARSKRQENVISAFKNKLLSAQTLINPAKIIELYTILKGSIDTDIKQDEFDDFIRLAQKMKNIKMQSAIIDYGDAQTKRPGLLINPQNSAKYNYAWVLIPRIGDGNFTEIHNYISCEISTGDCGVSEKPNY